MKSNNVKNLVNKVVNEEFINKIKNIKRRIFESDDKMCSECGSPMVENECIECGYMKESEMYEFEDPSWFEDTDEINKRLEKKHKEDFIGDIFSGSRKDDMINMVRDYREYANRYDQINRNREIGEGFDDFNIKSFRKDKDYGRPEFKKVPKGAKVDLRNLRDDSITPKKYMKNKIDDLKDLFKDNDDFDEYTELEEDKKGMCSECGSQMYEGECMECGYGAAEMGEELKGNQHKIDKNKNGRIDSEDFKMLRSKRELDELGGMDDGHPRFGKKRFPSKMTDDEIERILKGEDEPSVDFRDDDLENIDKMKRHFGKKRETKEGKKFPDLSGDGKVTRKDILLGRGVKLNGKKKTNESEIYQLTIDNKKHYFTESEMIDVIEKIVNEENKKGSNPTNVLKSAQGRSKDENEKNIEAVTKKMKDYLKKASKGSYEANPKHFPKGNGELGEMSKKAYKASNDVEEYVENFTAAALENIDYDDIKANEEWVEDNIVGSSRTGNNPEWANAVETDVNEKRNKIRKNNLLGKIKKKAYNKSPQPVNDVAGENADKASKILMNLESVENKKVINEIEKMKDLIGYGKKTQ